MNRRLAVGGWRLAFALACGVALHGAEVRTLVIPGTTLSVGAPAEWVTATPADGTIIRLADPRGAAGMAVTVAPLPAEQGPAAFTQETLTDLQRLAYEFDLLDWDFTRQLAGRTWSRLHFRFVVGETRWEQQLWLCVDNGQAVSVAYSARPAEWAAWQPVFDECVGASAGSRPVLAPSR